MEEQFRKIILEVVQPLITEIRLLREQLEEVQSKSISGKLISAKRAGELVGKSKATICRWCRGFELNGVFLQLKATRQPSGRFLIDERDLLAFNQQVTERFLTSFPIQLPPPPLPTGKISRRSIPL